MECCQSGIFLLIVTLLKLLILWHFESTDTCWSASLSGVSVELLSVKNVFRFSLRKNICVIRKIKIIKAKIWQENVWTCLIWKRKNIWSIVQIYMETFIWVFCDVKHFFKVVLKLWIRDWQTVQYIWCCFVFTLLFQWSRKTDNSWLKF